MNNIYPEKIKRIRTNKFTEKRNPYKKYLTAKWKWSDVMNEITNSKSTIKYIAKKYNINYTTLRQKYSYYKRNKLVNINDENRGGSKRKLNDIQEKELYSYIKENYVDNDGILNNNIIKEIVKEKAIQKFCNFKAKFPNNKYNHEQCVIDIMCIIKSISKKTIINSFDCLDLN